MNTRPLVHFTAPTGWINDPHGLTFHNGQYHHFFQYVPGSAEWAPGCHWGHAVSDTLFDWTMRPIALAPGDGDTGIWTGCLVTADSGPRIFYTATHEPHLGHGEIRVATPTDDSWDTWVKGEVVIPFPDIEGLHSFRDPVVFRDGEVWRMTVGAGFEGGTGAALAYSSSDLLSWTYDGVMAERNTSETEGAWTGSMWECPQVFDAAGKSSLVVSVWQDNSLYNTVTGTGVRDGAVLSDLQWSSLSFGTSMYAPTIFTDAAGRTCMMWWLRDVRSIEDGWTGAHSVPYELGVEGGRVVAVPHRDLYARRAPWTGESVAWDADWQPDADAVFEVHSAGRTIATVTRDGAQITVAGNGASFAMPFAGGAVRVIADSGILEIETDGRVGALALDTSTGPTTPSVSTGEWEIFALR